MGCIKSKEGKGPAMKYRPENAGADSVSAHVGHYGPDPTQLNQSPTPKGPASSYNSHSITPFGGSSIMTPFGGASSSFSAAVSSPFPGGVTGESRDPGGGGGVWVFDMMAGMWTCNHSALFIWRSRSNPENC